MESELPPDEDKVPPGEYMVFQRIQKFADGFYHMLIVSEGEFKGKIVKKRKLSETEAKELEERMKFG